jgi:hypothetical protein
MGKAFDIKPKTGTGYSDSFFYSNSNENYPTIDEQKNMAKTIAQSLENSNPQTSKYHLKKQKIEQQMAQKDGYESEPGNNNRYLNFSNRNNNNNTISHKYQPNPNEALERWKEEQRQAVIDSYLYDSSVPDVIKKSIAEATMNNNVSQVMSPDNFKQQHFTEHVTHTEMDPTACMDLAATLESQDPSIGGRGAQIFANRKAKSEKWVVDESNVKKSPWGERPVNHFCELFL